MITVSDMLADLITYILQFDDMDEELDEAIQLWDELPVLSPLAAVDRVNRLLTAVGL